MAGQNKHRFLSLQRFSTLQITSHFLASEGKQQQLEKMAPRNLQNRGVLSSSSSSSGGDGYGFFLVDEQEDREAPIQHMLTCENLRAYSPTKQSIVRNDSSFLSVSTIGMSTMSPNSSQRNSPRILEDREEKEDFTEIQKNVVFVFENNRAPGS